ncbi:phosphopantothenoylcysteine decarboxylase [Rubrobacter indicoceani]|uniref:phosphopantothenoylcysteine decarboxylase domain-containing protein n=1 Tax=Rubrobacter indicoceani TaxID=2051957 RepID=UPI000E5ADF35|nr:phosphopantothenoylcysteine decarboxylase [Rubrobacter indicoceani]
MILLAVGAAFGAVEAPKLACELVSAGHRVDVMLNDRARLFAGPSSFAAVGAKVIETPSEEPEATVCFPATIGTVARLARGLEPLGSGPTFVVPELDGASAANPAVLRNIESLVQDGVRVLENAGVEAVALEVLGELAELSGPLAGRRVVVTAGGTHEPIDSVRFIGNRSSGKMGLAVAREARLLGAEVVVVAANIPVREPGVSWVAVETVGEMERAVHEAVSGADVLVMAAAVSDFTPASVPEGKIRRGASKTLTLELTATSDVLGGIRERFPELVLVGFAATHGDPAPDAREKLTRKGADFIVGNDISRSDVGFGTENNEVVIVGPESERFVQKAAKSDVARAILEGVVEKLRCKP